MSRKPLTFASIDDMPDRVVSLASMEHNHTGTWRYIKPIFENKVPPCSHGCPAGTDVEGFIQLIEQGRFTDAWVRLKEENPLTRVCGRVCFHPCETACNRGRYDLSVSINALERFAGEHADRSKLPAVVAEPTGKTIAVVGSGPAGLTAASYLARMGHKVTVFEMMDQAGGILRYGIPVHRLPREVLDEEIEDILSLGVELRCGVKVGRSNGKSFDDLSGFDAVFLAVGAYHSRPLGIPGEDAKRVITGLELLRAVASGETLDLGERAAVIGGGNTALDVARVLVRLGVRVDIYYRRGRAEMPAFEEEVEEALREGVYVHTLVAPVGVDLDDAGNVRAVKLIRMRLGDPDESGRRRPEPIDDSEHSVETDSVIACVGELVDPDSTPDDVDRRRDGSVNVDEFGHSSMDSLWAGGDVTPNERTVVSAISMGKRAAVAIDRYLAGAPKREIDAVLRVGDRGCVSMSRYLSTGDAHASYDDANHIVKFDELNTAHFVKAERARLSRAPFPARLDGFPEVNLGIAEEQVRTEASRCFHCGVCNECDNCYVFCPDVAILPKPDAFGYTLNYDFCKGCGICAVECPRASMTMVEE